MPEHQTNKERLKEITDSIEKGIQELFQSDKYAQYLRTMSRFHRYSLNNTMLIYMQKPDATLVAGFNRWRDQFGRNVMKGEKGIKIIAPTPFKKKVEKERLDPDTHLPMLDADGKIMTEEKVIQIPMFKPVTVFDVSQTQGRPLPQLASDLTGNVENYKDFMEALSKASPVPIHIRPVAGGADGFFDPETQSITIREGMSEIQTVSAAVHEIAHSKLHNYEHDGNTDPSQHKSRRTEEVEAESISYAVCAYFGISTGENSFGYIASWSKDKELPELKASLETINKTSSELITDIDRNYTQLVKARQEAMKQKREQRQMNVLEMVDYFMSQGISEEQANELAAAEWEARKVPSAPAKEPPAEKELPVPDPSVSVEAMNSFGYTNTEMLPLSKERALELFEQDVPVYMLYDNNSEAMAFEAEDIRLYSGYFGVNRADWAQAADRIPPMQEAQVRQKQEADFLKSSDDGFAIYQLRPSDETASLMFMDSAWLKKKGLVPQKDNYDLVYTGKLEGSGNQAELLETIYRDFNIKRPADFSGHSLSVSDIIALRQGGVVSCHYVDSIGYQKLPDFLVPENYLRSAEMQMEDDYNMLDGIVNNGTRPEEKEVEKPSVLEKLHSYQQENYQSVHNRAERDLE